MAANVALIMRGGYEKIETGAYLAPDSILKAKVVPLLESVTLGTVLIPFPSTVLIPFPSTTLIPFPSTTLILFPPTK